MSAVIRFGEEQLVRFARTGMWISLKCFRTEPAGLGLSDDALLAALLSDDHYHDHYAGEPIEQQTHHTRHGPYRLSAIAPDSFLPARADDAATTIRRWLAQHVIGDLSPAEHDVLTRQVLPVLGHGVLYRLPPLGEPARHD